MPETVPEPIRFNGRLKFYPRVTTLVKAPSDLWALSQWSQRMVAKGLSQRPDLLALVASLDFEEKDKLNEVCEDAKVAAGSKAGANVGTALHSFSEQVDRGFDVYIPDPWKVRIDQYQETLRKARLLVVPEYMERTILNTNMGAAGTFDRIFREPDGTLVIGDLKTGRDLEYSQKEIAIQLFLYADASRIVNYRPEPDKFGYRLPDPDQNPHLYTAMPEVRQDYGYVVHLPRDGEGCHLYKVDLEAGRYGAELSRRVRAWRKRAGLFQKICVEDNGPSTDVWVEKIQNAQSVETLNSLYREARDRGVWNDTLLEAAKTRKQALLSGDDFRII